MRAQSENATKPNKRAGETIVGQRQLARAIGRSVSAVNAWINDPRWGFGPGPWRRDDVPLIREWAIANLRCQSGDFDDAFWSDRQEPDPLPPVSVDGAIIVPPKELPDRLVSKLERDLLAGKRSLTAEQVHEYVALNLLFRGVVTNCAQRLAPALAGRSEVEIGRRLRATLQGAAEGIAKLLEPATTRTAGKAGRVKR